MRDVGRFLRSEWDRAAGYACLLGGLVALVVGIDGVRYSADIVDEISYLVSGGIGAMFLLGAGATLLLSADLQDDFRKLDRVEERLQAIHEALLAEHPDLVEPPGPVGPAAPQGTDGARLRRARRVSAGIVGAAGVLFVAGAVTVANEPDAQRLSPGVGLALVGALLAATAGAGLVGQLKGTLERRQLAVLGPWAQPAPHHATQHHATQQHAAGARSPAESVRVVDGLSLYHRDGCHALVGRPANAVGRSELPVGARPCGLCEPDGQ
ncbi:MAG TPA: hypothetical protein VFS16_08280 [Acidimicrobiia bacterium]|nr:hypothetical protein [Acidimicrobiia bacterium]